MRRQDLDKIEIYEGWDKPLTRIVEKGWEEDGIIQIERIEYKISFDHELTEEEISKFQDISKIAIINL